MMRAPAACWRRYTRFCGKQRNERKATTPAATFARQPAGVARRLNVNDQSPRDSNCSARQNSSTSDPAAILARFDELLARLSDVDEYERRLDRDLRIAEAERAELARVERQIARVYELERENARLRLSLAIARDECNRAYARIAELEGALDAIQDGLDAKIPPGRRTLPPPTRPGTVGLAGDRGGRAR